MATLVVPIYLDSDEQTTAEAEFLAGSPIGDAPFDPDGGLEPATNGHRLANLMTSPKASPSGPACCAG